MNGETFEDDQGYWLMKLYTAKFEMYESRSMIIIVLGWENALEEGT